MFKNKKEKTTIFDCIYISIIVVLVSAFCMVPLIKNLNFGLDLAGGFEVLYQVDSLDGSEVTDDMVKATYKIINKRIDVLGVSEPEISIEGNNIRVDLAGVTDADTARNTISATASLTFRDTEDNLLMTADVLNSGQAKVTTGKTGKYEIALSIKDNDTFYEKTKEISKLSSSDKKNMIVIWLDYQDGNSYESEKARCGNLAVSNCLSAATVSQGFYGDVVIQGNFTKEEATNLVELINSGSMPTKLTEISSRTVTASFGEDSLHKTFVASIIAFILICLIMIAIYRISGIISSIGILTYTFLTLLIFYLVGGRLTLHGIAALVIGIGMAVDSISISFSRIKEELQSGINLKEAFAKGNKQSFVSILDANLTTLIAAIILFIFGESSVKGFATVLIISIIVTFLIMVYFTRFLLGLYIKTDKFKNKTNLFIGFKKKDKAKLIDKINFVKYRKIIFAAVIFIILLGGLVTYKDGLHLGIDFKGGSNITINAKDLDIDTVKTDISDLGYELESIDQINDNITYITINNVLDNEGTSKVEKYFNEKYEATTSVGAISTEVKKELTKNAIKALLLAALGMIIYTTIRFKFSYGLSAIIALLHDVTMIIVLFSLLRIEINSIFIAAVLSIIGYSINDTIVLFDRVRENKSKLKKDQLKNITDLENLVNNSLRQVFTRCIITSITTLIPVICLILFGSYEIINFNLALLFGLVCGTFSSLFISTQIWMLIEKYNLSKPKKGKWYEDKNNKKKEPTELLVKGINC